MLRATGYNKSAVSAQTSPHPRYHFHGWAAENITGDSKFFDRSGIGNHAVRGANLSEANMLANAGYVSGVDPAGGATDSVLRIPKLNLYHAGGEKLILYWLGKATAEGSDQAFIADGGSATYPGFRIICKSTGVIQFGLYDSGGGSDFTGTSTSVPFDGALHSIALVVDGQNKKYAYWVDEAVDASLSGAYANFALAGRDTRNSNTVNIGQGAPASAVSANGMAVQTRALHILRLGASDPIPSIATMTQVFTQLRPDPSKPILGGAF